MTAAPAPDSSTIPPESINQVVRVIFGLYMMVLNIILVYLLIRIWPGKLPVDPGEQISVFWGKLHFYLTPETRYLSIVVLTGALGSYIHTATSFADFVGNRQFYASWTWWYLLRPFIGVALSLIVYFAVRGGLIGGSTGADALSPYGVAAIAGLAGLFSKQATDKLREVFENLFKTEHPPNRTDKLTT